jgi:hypothetical protein
MKKILLYAMVMTFAIFTACKKDDNATPDSPKVTAPSQAEVIAEASTELTFNFVAAGGFNSSEVSATGGTATIKTNGADGAKDGSIVVTFTAGAAAGAGSVVLKVTDKNNQETSSTAVLSVVEEQIVFSVSEDIAADVTWETGNVYVLEGRIAVLDGVTLTIQPGTIVKGQVGSGVNATALVIARGAKLMAEGTATSPIIFTSIADEIMPGQIESPNLLPTDKGLWGGLIILGKARASLKNDVTESHVEGLPDTYENGYFGGTDDTDNSGTITYVSIRHGGTALSEGNEINGLSLGAVGSGTTINHVEIIGNDDDGIEWFGGSVNVSDIVIWNPSDDGIDTDMSYRGTIDNFVVINVGDACFELDGPEGSTRIDDANHTIQNGLVIAGDAEELCDNDDNTNVNMNSIYFRNVKGQLFHTMPTYANCTFSNFEITVENGKTVSDYFQNGFDAYATAVTENANTVGADLTEFNTWSWARIAGEF